MAGTIEDVIADWDGLGVVCRFDAPTGTWIFVCLHDDTLGPCTGGTRLRAYPTPADAVRDGTRLAEGMTRKWAGIGMRVGGGKAVLAVPGTLDGEARRGLLGRYGRLVASLGGAFRTGEDLGTTQDDMLVIARETRYVHGFDPAGTKLDPGPYTARGVYEGLRAALAAVFGTPEPAGRRVLIEGLGSVGTRLAGLLAAGGAELLVADVDEARVNAAVERFGARGVPPAAVPDTDCDVYAPCAVGATIDRAIVSRLRCRIVAGAANNQLAEPADAGRLAARGILWVPDYVINAGGAIAFALLDSLGPGEALDRRVAEVGRKVAGLLDEAAASGDTPLAVAERRVAQALSAEPPPEDARRS